MRFVKSWKKIGKNFFVAIGFLLLLIEFCSIFIENLTETIRNYEAINFFIIFIVLSFFYAFLTNIPKSSFKVKIRDRDTWIKIKIGDAFKNQGSLVVPFNDYLDVSLAGNVKKVKSIQNKLIVDYFDGEDINLKSLIDEKTKGKQLPLDIWDVVEIEKTIKNIFWNKLKRFYFLINTKKQENGRVSSSIDDFMVSVNRLWDFLSKDTTKWESIIVPLINTQHWRNSGLTRDVVAKLIIDTFIESSKHNSVCEELIISIHKNDIEQWKLDFDDLCNYLSFQAKNYKNIQFDTKPEWQWVEMSTIKSIKS